MTSSTFEPGLTMSDAARAAVHSDNCELPVLPEVAIQLLDLTANVDCKPGDIVALFKRDQSLTGHLLQIVNSARYSSGQTVTSIQQAVARLGLLRVREIVILVSCQSKVFDVRGFEDEVRLSFQRSLATAAFSQEVARVRRLNVEDAFLCGLLHDIGRPVLLQSLADLQTSSELTDSADEVRSAAEEHRVAMACRLVLSWKLPERIAETIEYQSAPLKAPNTELQSAMLNLAIHLADRALEGGEETLPEVSHPLAEVLSLYPEDLQSIALKGSEIIDWVWSTT